MGHVGQPHVLSLGNQRYIDPKTYKQLVWADLADEEEEEAQLERQIARQLLAGHTRAAAAGAAAAAAGEAGAAGWRQHGRQGMHMPSSCCPCRPVKHTERTC
jgi:hypothetical protein